MSLKQKSISKAEKLLEDDKLQLVESNVYLVYGSEDNVYPVEFNKETKFVKCKCKGFKIHRDCYHSEAVRRKEEI